MDADTPTRAPGITRSSVWLAGGFALTAACLLGTDLVIIDTYGPGAHGRFTLALSVALAGALLCDLGLAGKAGVRAIVTLRGTRDRALGAAIGRMMMVVLLAGLLGALGLNLLAGVLGPALAPDAFELRQASIWLFAGAGVRACAMVFVGFERMAFVAVLGVLAEASRLGWSLACAAMTLDMRYLYLGFSLTWVVALLVCMACVAVMLGRAGVRLVWWPIDARLALRAARDGLAYLPPLLTHQALGPALYLAVGLTLTLRGGGDSDAADVVSVLRISLGLALVLGIASQALATSLFPAAARRAAAEGAAALRPTLLRALRALAVVGAAVLVAYLVLGRWALGWLDPGPQQTLYSEPGYAALIVFTIAVALDGLRLQADQVLMATGRVRTVVRGELLKFGLVVVGAVLIAGLAGPWRALGFVPLLVCFVLMVIALRRIMRAFDVVKPAPD